MSCILRVVWKCSKVSMGRGLIWIILLSVPSCRSSDMPTQPSTETASLDDPREISLEHVSNGTGLSQDHSTGDKLFTDDTDLDPTLKGQRHNVTGSTSSRSRQFGILPVLFPPVWAGIIQAGMDIYSYNVTDDCKVELYHYAVDLQRRKDWAINMYDATGKQGPGLIKGLVTWHGNYDQCRAVRHSMTSHGSGSDVKREIQAQYCSASFDSPGWLEDYIADQHLPFPVHLPHLTEDICIPTGCVQEDLTTIINTYKDQSQINISLVSITCQEDLRLVDDAAAVFSVCVLATFASLVLLGTMVTIIVKLTTPKGEVKNTIQVGFFSRRGSVFSVARRNSVRSNRSSVFSRWSSTHSKRGSNLYRLDSVKPDSVEHLDVVEVDERSASMDETSFTVGNHESTHITMAEEGCVRQNSQLQPIDELPVTCSSVKMEYIQRRQNTQTEEDPLKAGSRKIGGVITDTLLCFSFPNNVASVLGEGNTNILFCLNGVRFLSISWIVMGNSISFIHKAPDTVENSVTGVEFAQSLWFQAIINCTFAADTFFILSGTLLSYNFLRGINKKTAAGEKFKVTPKLIILFYLHRIVRIWPCYLVVVMIFTNILPYMGQGPRWKYVSSTISQCKDHWWANVFFFSNFYKADEMCMSWTYYLVNDFQFYLISPVILIPLVRSPRLGFTLIGFLVATQVVSVGILNNKINGNMLRMDSGYFSDVYAKPYCRVGVFAIGMMLGYILNKVGRRVYLRKLLLLLGWLTSMCTMTFVVYVTYLENRVGGSRWTAPQTALYEALARPAWGLAVSWVIFSCSIGQGGYIGKFLSWNFFLPLCRITFGIYLIHPLVIVVVLGATRNLVFLSPLELWLFYVSILVTATALALVLMSCVEQPFVRLEKLIQTIA
ncbi:O-acyltransferase like protein-like isoform X1 [Haliotis cracherodii]|uniref:O-acyltransferase like protein-like isoform X1 n=1 Tax=Haliotis cracherodii TaxID=6455 RepID=UPI0039EBAED9